jgi:hypothetical protein
MGMKKTVVMGRKVPLTEQEEKGIDREFWRRVGAERRFRAAWEMVGEADAIRGGDGSQPRLQRSVQNIQRVRR